MEVAGIRLKRDWVSFKRMLLMCNAFIFRFKYHCSSQQSLQMPSKQVGEGCRVQDAEGHGGPTARSQMGRTLMKSMKQFRHSFYQQPYFYLHQERNRQECTGLTTFSYMLLIWKRNTSPTVLPGSFPPPHRDILFANCKLLTNTGALNLSWRDVSLFENKTGKAKWLQEYCKWIQ